MNKLLAGYFGVLLALGCGVSPQDAADGLDDNATHSEQWCGWDFDTIVDKIFPVPDGYGFTAAGGCFAADTTWPGGYCYAPASTTQIVRLFQDTQDAAWFKNSTDEYGAVANRLNAIGWNVSRVSNNTYTTEVRTSTTHPDGWLGNAVPTQVATSANTHGELRLFSHCVATLYRTSIEANQFYQAASAAQKIKYLKNLWDHEMGHCTGLGHLSTADELMSVTYYAQGPYFNSNLNPNADELADYAAYADLN